MAGTVTKRRWLVAALVCAVLAGAEALATHAPGDFETALEVFREAADFWRGQGVPIWVFVDGVGGGGDLPQLDKGA